MKRFLIASMIFLLRSGMTTEQSIQDAIYFPTQTRPYITKGANLQPGSNLIVNQTSIAINPILSARKSAVVPFTTDREPFLFGEVDPTKGDSAVQACILGSLAPIAVSPAAPVACEPWRAVAIDDDLMARVKILLNAVPPQQLIDLKLDVVQ